MRGARPNSRNHRVAGRGFDTVLTDESYDGSSMPSPVIFYPPELPVSAARDEIADAIRDNQVVIVAGATGSVSYTHLTLPTNREV